MSEYDVNVSTGRLKEIEGIVADAFDRMAQSAKTIGAQGDAISVAYRGSGTATAMDSYGNLAGAGTALSDALQGLKDDLGLTGEHGHETDQAAQEAMHRGASSITLGMQG
ncbi:aliphatic sulfonate ABC transporter substrate-binding protein [Streptomyces sp. TRM70308]|uniref:aliphatic sulfonate ABC transporter substrate-binding protein n=1 Tax=Streptomyces sp. TRM70308 TaxID=3131932 RepID=UPI003D00CCD6